MSQILCRSDLTAPVCVRVCFCEAVRLGISQSVTHGRARNGACAFDQETEAGGGGRGTEAGSRQAEEKHKR